MKSFGYFLLLIFLSSNLLGGILYKGGSAAETQDTTKSRPSGGSNYSVGGESNFSGYYVFDGKMYFYNQETGTFSPVEGGSGSVGKTQDESELLKPDQKIELMNKLRNDDSNIKESLKRPAKLANISRNAQEVDEDELACTKWGSPLLGNKSYAGKEECDGDLENELDKALISMDKYVDNFEKAKIKLMISSDLEQNTKLSPIKLSFPLSNAIISKSRKMGCICLN